MSDGSPLVRAENLTKYYTTEDGFLDRLLGDFDLVKALDGVDLEVHEGETLGLVGETGCGKSTLGRTLLQLEEPRAGSVYYDGVDLTELPEREMDDYRTDLQYIFQDPFASLNPRMTVNDIIGEALDIHGWDGDGTRADRIRELLELVGLSANHAGRYPHEFSGGQRQRIGIARALAVDPDFIVCDEPVSALDVSVQAQILNLLADLQEEFGLSYLFIAHDLSVIEHVSDRIAVMYLGEIVETGTTEEVFDGPSHPYTEALLSAIPEPDPLWTGARTTLEGTVPSPVDPPASCRFHTRCPQVIQPGDVDLDQSTWRAVMDLRVHLQADDVDLESLAVTRTDEVDGSAAAEVDAESVRAAYGLADPLGDPAAEEALSTAAAQVAAGEFAAAEGTLAERFESPCEVDAPELTAWEDHPIACHLFDDRYDAEPGGRATE